MVSQTAVSDQCRDGVIERWQRGVYAPAGMPSTFHAELTAACLRLGEGAVAIGLTAARLWRLPDTDTIDRIELAMPRRHVPRLGRGVVVRGYPWLEDDHVVRVGRFRVLDPDHTIADLCRVWGADRVLDAAAELWRRRRGDGPEGLAQAAAVRGGFRGAATLHDVRDRLDPGFARTRSIAEVRAYRHLRGSELPTPEVNERRRMTSGRRWEFDLLWDPPQAILEIDGARHHGPSRREHDARKDADAAADGYLLRRVPAALTADREAFLHVVRQLLADAASA